MTDTRARGIEQTSRFWPTAVCPVSERACGQVNTQGPRFSLMASSARVRAILDLVSELSEAEREELRDELDADLTPEQWKSAWDEELLRRIIQVAGGEVQCATLDEVAEHVLKRA
jgi:hypothetical protein